MWNASWLKAEFDRQQSVKKVHSQKIIHKKFSHSRQANAFRHFSKGGGVKGQRLRAPAVRETASRGWRRGRRLARRKPQPEPGTTRGIAPVVLRRGRNFPLQRAQEGRKTSQWDVLRRGTLAGGSPMRRIRILRLCIWLFAKKFFDTLSPGGKHPCVSPLGSLIRRISRPAAHRAGNVALGGAGTNPPRWNTACFRCSFIDKPQMPFRRVFTTTA